MPNDQEIGHATPNLTSARYMQGMDQARHRDHAVWFDQHRTSTYRDAKGNAIFTDGRPYYSVIEKATRMPVGPVFPYGWEAPAYAPQQYLVRSIGRITNLPTFEGSNLLKTVTSNRFALDYQSMKRDDTEHWLAHWKLAVNTAAANGWEPPKPHARMDPRLLAIVGPAPRNPKIAEAMAAGNPWILGMKVATWNAELGKSVVEPDEELLRLLTLNREEVVTMEDLDRYEIESARRENLPSDTRKELDEVLAEARAKSRELDALLAAHKAAPKSKGGRPKGSRNTPRPTEPLAPAKVAGTDG